MDPGLCGLKGFSITHYLIKLLHCVLTTWDKSQPHAVLAACIDLSKADDDDDDDGTVAVSINLKTSLLPDTVQRPQHHNYHERTSQVLPPQNNLLQSYLEDTEKFTLENKMIINPKKTKIIFKIFNPNQSRIAQATKLHHIL